MRMNIAVEFLGRYIPFIDSFEKLEIDYIASYERIKWFEFQAIRTRLEKSTTTIHIFMCT